MPYFTEQQIKTYMPGRLMSLPSFTSKCYSFLNYIFVLKIDLKTEILKVDPLKNSYKD